MPRRSRLSRWPVGCLLRAKGMGEESLALSPVELAKAKLYMKADTEADDALVEDCVLGAREYLAQAGVALPGADIPRRRQYDLVCHALALGSYDLRDPVMAGTTLTENIQLRRSLNQLKFTEPRG